MAHTESTSHVSAPPAAASIGLTLWPGVAALIAVMGIARFAYTPILPDMLSAGALSMTDAGWVASANFLGYLAGALVATAVKDRLLQDRLLWCASASSCLRSCVLQQAGPVRHGPRSGG